MKQEEFLEPQMNTDKHGWEKEKTMTGDNNNVEPQMIAAEKRGSVIAEKEYLHKDLTREIIDSAFKVHNALGCGLLEKVYNNALSWDLEIKKLEVTMQREYSVIYREKSVGLYYADLVVDGRVIVEVKSVEKIDDVHRAQLLNYLRISRLRVGLLVNFARPKLEFERLIV